MIDYKFMIYAEGGSKTFMGHLMRTVTLAYELRRLGITVIFVTSSQDGKDYISKNNFRVIVIKELDYEKLADLAEENGVLGIMVDRFGFTRKQHQLLAERIGLLVQIDDFLYDGPAQMVINSTIDKQPVDRGGIWLCGGEYAIIRKNFVGKKRKILEEPKDILITTGYGDPGHVHLKMIYTVKKVLKNVRIHVVVGGGYDTKAALRELSAQDSDIILYENIYDISEITKKVDFAISAAGTTLYELAAAGVPTIAFSLYDNQIDNIRRVEQKGCIVSIGWYENIDYKNFEQQLLQFYGDVCLRRQLSYNGMKWIDGFGGERVAGKILEEMQKNGKNCYSNN